MATLLVTTNSFSGMAEMQLEMQLECHKLSVVLGRDFFFLMHPLHKSLMLIIIETELAVFFLRNGE